MKTGWICPRCETANAPSVKTCACKPATVTVGPPKQPQRITSLKDPPGAPPRIIYSHGPRML